MRRQGGRAKGVFFVFVFELLKCSKIHCGDCTTLNMLRITELYTFRMVNFGHVTCISNIKKRKISQFPIEIYEEIDNMKIYKIPKQNWGFPDGSEGKEPACNAGGTGDMGSVPGLGRFPGEGNGNPLQYSCL